MRAAGLVVALAACSEPAEVQALAEASTEVSFEAVDGLGPHHLLGRLRTTAHPDSGPPFTTDEVLEIRWQDWDNFEYRRSTDGKLTTALVTSGGVAWQREGDDRWEERPDAEPYRVELRHAWSLWDTALEPFRDRISFTDKGEERMEGRGVRRYGLSLTPEPPAEEAPGDGTAAGRAKSRKRARPAPPVRPRTLEGDVWVDAATAVRLMADVRGEAEHRGVRREIHLQLTRSEVGQDQPISPPPADERRKRRQGPGGPDPAPRTP